MCGRFGFLQHLSQFIIHADAGVYGSWVYEGERKENPVWCLWLYDGTIRASKIYKRAVRPTLKLPMEIWQQTQFLMSRTNASDCSATKTQTHDKTPDCVCARRTVSSAWTSFAVKPFMTTLMAASWESWRSMKSIAKPPNLSGNMVWLWLKVTLEPTTFSGRERDAKVHSGRHSGATDQTKPFLVGEKLISLLIGAICHLQLTRLQENQMFLWTELAVLWHRHYKVTTQRPLCVLLFLLLVFGRLCSNVNACESSSSLPSEPHSCSWLCVNKDQVAVNGRRSVLMRT